MTKNLLVSIFSLLALILNAQEKPNIVFIEVDDLPAHYTTLKGATKSKTPTVQKLADEGIYFNNTICQGTMCGPSRNSFITGTYPHNIGFYENGKFEDIPQGTWALPGAMQRAGYYTAHIGKSHLHPKTVGKKTSTTNREAHENVLGFDYVWNSLGRSVTSGREMGYGKDMYVDFILDYDKEHGTKYYDKLRSKEKMSTLPDDIYLDGLYTKMALDFIEEKKDDTYFLWLNYSVPHGPNDVKASYHTFADSDIPSVNYKNDPGTNIPVLLRPHPLDWNNDKLKREQKGQLANVSFMDYQVKRVLQAIDDSGNKSKTIVVFFSDHGILFGDHGLIHKSTLYKEVLNSSLIIMDPRNTVHNNRIVTRPVELLDLVKTTLDWAQAKSIDKNTPRGETLLPLLNETNSYSKTYAVAECPGYYAYVTEGFKYIAPFYFEDSADKQEVLFDLVNDPNERVNIASSRPEIIEEYRVLAQKWLDGSGTIVLQGDVYTNPTLGIEDEAFSFTNFSIYPNPTTNYIKIYGDFDKTNVISIHSTDGRLVLRNEYKKPSSRIISIDTKTLSSGTYIVTVNNNSFRIIKE